MNELQAIKKFGIATSRDLERIIDKSLRNIQKQLRSLQNINVIHVIIFKTELHRRPVYINDEVFKCLCKIT